MRKTLVVAGAIAVLCAAVAAQEKIDFAAIEKIRAEGMQRSKILETFDYLVTTIGPRLTNSPAHRPRRAVVAEQMKAMGLADVHTEGFQFGRGWTLNKVSIEMVEPRYMPLIGLPAGMVAGTPGRVVPRRSGFPGLDRCVDEGASRQVKARFSSRARFSSTRFAPIARRRAAT
jgi:hypothetical protein